MATLRTFQHDIEEIHHREQTKQREAALLQSEKDKEKDVKVKLVHEKVKGKEKEDSVNAGNAKAPVAGVAELSVQKDALDDMIISLQELLGSATETEASESQIRDLLASLLTRRRGELLIRLGNHPERTALFAASTGPQAALATPLRVNEGPMSPVIAQAAKRLESAATSLGATSTMMFNSNDPSPHAHYLVRLPPPSVERTLEVRCAVVGNVDSGKSTTLSVLTRGALDDGRGRARVVLFRHKHEIESGRTSSVGMEILGFTTSGTAILPALIPAGTNMSVAEALAANAQDPAGQNVARHQKLAWDEISANSAKVVSFIDLAGHERYLKTTLYGLTSGAPDAVVLMVGANAGLIGMSKEHLAVALALSVPICVVITIADFKIDMTPANVLEDTVKQVIKILKSPGCRKTPVFVKSAEVAIELSQHFVTDRLCPIFLVSNVTGQGLDLVRTFLNMLPSSEGDEDKFVREGPLEFSITEVWSVPYVGVVVNGILNSGSVKAGDNVLLGPDSNGGWMVTSIKSIQRKRATVTSAEAGQCVSFALKRVRRIAVRKGMVIVSRTDTPPKSVRRFEGQVLILYHNTTLQRNYQAMLHCGAIRQTVRIVSMDKVEGVLRTGDRATVEFEFISSPEYIKEGMKLLFREGKTKGLGVVTRILP